MTTPMPLRSLGISGGTDGPGVSLRRRGHLNRGSCICARLKTLAAVPRYSRGQDFIRGLIAQGLNINNTSSAAAFARQRWGSTTKAAVPAITTPGTVGDEAGAAASEFFAAVTQPRLSASCRT